MDDSTASLKLAPVDYNASRPPWSPYDEASDGKLGSVYTALTEFLARRGRWSLLDAARDEHGGRLRLPDKYDCLFATAQGKGIAWGSLGYGMWPPPLVNYLRGFEAITRKSRLALTLESASAECGGSLPAELPSALAAEDAVRGEDPWALCPQSFVFYPSRSKAAPFVLNAIRAAVEEQPGEAWILKPSDGSKGDGISLSREWCEIESFLVGCVERCKQGEKVSAVVVQRYISNPLLLSKGRRKFDIRVWVLVNAQRQAFLYSQGVARASSVPYDESDLENRHAHLTNHCIAAEHASYGQFEVGNEIWYDQLDAELTERFPNVGGSVLRRVLLPQIRRQVVQSLLSSRPLLLEARSDYYKSFQLFGFDFLVDSGLRVWLCEINASPAVAARLLPSLVRGLAEHAIYPNFDSSCRGSTQVPTELSPGEEGQFELIYTPAVDVDEPEIPSMAVNI